MDYIYVFKKGTGNQFHKCFTTQIKEQVFHHFAIVSANQEEDTRVSSIDIDMINF